MKPGKIIEKIANFIPFLAVFVASLFHPSDPDLGWYLKYGEYFFKNHSILRENIFSSQMTDFKWVNHSWGTDLITYLTFNNFGFLGFSILGAFTITTTFYFFSKAAKLDIFEKALIFPPLLYFLSPLNSVSFRGQLLSLMLLGILTYILTITTSRHSHPSVVPTKTRIGINPSENPILNQVEDDKILYLLPLLFAIWSNLHGQFILGLAVFAIWIAANISSEIFQSGLKATLASLCKRPGLGSTLSWKRPGLKLIAVFAASALAVSINPYGIGVYEETLKHFGNPLEAYISEWIPFKMLTIPWWGQVFAGLTVFFGIIFLAFTDKIKSKIPQISIAAIVYMLSFSVRRFVWPMYYLVIPLFAPVAGFFKPESKRYANIAGSCIFLIYLILTFAFANPIKRLQNMSWQSYCQKYVFCSDSAINYLKDNLNARLLNAPPAGEAGRLLTYYGWGGYMIANHPEIKPSVDGRMTLWRNENGPPSRAGEAGYSAFEEYYAYEQNRKEIDDSNYNVVLMYKEKPLYNHLLTLVEAGKWQQPYVDQFSGVFVRSPVSF